MNEKQIIDNYAKMEIEQLKTLCDGFDELESQAVPLLQKELIARKEIELAMSITERLLAAKYIIIDDDIFDYLIKQIDNGLTETEIEKKLNDEFNFDQARIEITKAKFRAAGKSNLFLGSGLILIPLIIGLIIIFIGGQIAGLLAIIIITSGIVKIIKGYKQVVGLKPE